MELERLRPARRARLQHDRAQLVLVAQRRDRGGRELDGRWVVVHRAHQHDVHAGARVAETKRLPMLRGRRGGRRVRGGRRARGERRATRPAAARRRRRVEDETRRAHRRDRHRVRAVRCLLMRRSSRARSSARRRRSRTSSRNVFRRTRGSSLPRSAAHIIRAPPRRVIPPSRCSSSPHRPSWPSPRRALRARHDLRRADRRDPHPPRRNPSSRNAPRSRVVSSARIRSVRPDDETSARTRRTTAGGRTRTTWVAWSSGGRWSASASSS